MVFFILYQLIQIIALPLIILVIGILHIKRGIIGNFAQRLGWVPRSTSHRHTIWLHAVSVGEVLSLQELIIALKAQNPDTDCYVTVGTLAGMRIARAQLTHTDRLSYLPYDFLACILLAYARIKPKALIIVESDVWPNLVSIGHYKKVPLILLNARLSQRSRKQKAVARYFFNQLYNCFDIILAQSENDKDNFVARGVTTHIEVVGNVKAYNVVGKKERMYAPAVSLDTSNFVYATFDTRDGRHDEHTVRPECFGELVSQNVSKDELKKPYGVHGSIQPPTQGSGCHSPRTDLLPRCSKRSFRTIELARETLLNPRIILVGSLHPGEADIYLNLFTSLRTSHPHLTLILAPRHFGWQEELIAKVKNTGLRYFVWIEETVPPTSSPEREQALRNIFTTHDIVLVCTLGELFSLYQYANLFFLGGTFVPVGGHNLLEPAVWGIPTIVGPYYHNCTDIVERLKKIDGIAQVATPEALASATRILLENHEQRRSIGMQSQSWVYNEAQTVQHVIENLVQRI
jgi:3-deoxy-D-manno-octulosonic-acid transferase